jgi:phage tail-like protein
MPNPGTFTEPFRAYNFKLMIGGVTEGHFIECSNIGITVQAIKYREGGQSQVTHSLPGQVEYSDVTLSYGLTSSRELWDWFMTAVQGKVERRNVSIIMLDSEGIGPVTQWDLINAWPSEWRGTLLNALTRDAAIERLTLVFERLERQESAAAPAAAPAAPPPPA